MNIDLTTIAAFLGSIAAIISALFVLFKWAEDQENAKHEQLRRDIGNEVRAEIYKSLLELDIVRLLGSQGSARNLKSLI